jgi:UDP-glucose 4-epimerase
MKKLNGKTVFVTGGAGFVGSNMCELLVQKGARVIVYDNLSSGRYEFIKRHIGKKFKFIKADLLDRKSLSAAVKGNDIDLIIHLAANPDISLGTRQTDLDLFQGTVATYYTLEEARKNDIKEFMLSSTSVIYGIAGIRPTPEHYGPLLPISLYGASKLASEGFISSFSHLYGMDYYLYRFANVVGRNSTHGVVVDFLRKLRRDPRELEVLGNGKQRKSYIDVQDLCNAMIEIYTKSKSRSNVYNLATNGQTTVDYIAKRVIAKVAPKARIRHTGGIQGWPGDIANTHLSNKRMLKAGVRLKFPTSNGAVDNYIDSDEVKL